MSAATIETLDISICSTETEARSSSARAEASRANGRLSRGPTSTEGKARSRRNGCKDGLTGKGVVLPEEAAAEVDRLEAGFARDLQPKNAVERDLVRQMALGSWRSRVLFTRILAHDARMNAARFANWEPDQRLAAVEAGRRLGEDPEATVARLRSTSAGCDWMIERWKLLGNGLTTADEGDPGCSWTDTDLGLALDLLGRSKELRHLDEWPGLLESLRTEARSGSAEAVSELREIIAAEVAELETRSEDLWEQIEKPQLLDWRAGVEIDLEAEGTRLRRYEAAADRLFRSSLAKLEKLRKERGEPLMPRSEPAPPPAPPAPAAVPARRELAFPEFSPPGDPLATLLDFAVGGLPRVGIGPRDSSRDKTNPTPRRR